MSDSVTVTSRQSWFSRIGGAIAGVLFGIILFLGSFLLLGWNEGRAIHRAQTLEAGRSAVISVPASPVDPANNGKLIHISGDTVTTAPVSDSLFGLSATAIKLRRNVTMYQWVEDKKSETKKNLGGSEETVTTYSYKKEWNSSAIDSSEFNTPTGHQNPGEFPVEGQTFSMRSVTVGDFTLSESLIDRVDDFEPFPITRDTPVTTDFDSAQPIRPYNQGFYYGKDPQTPAIGDLKITFETVPLGPVSIIAAQNGDTFEPYIVEGTGDIELLQVGTYSADSMFASEMQANAFLTWALRFVGFFLMWFGLALITRPISVMADIVPLFGTLAETGLGFLSLIIALPLTFVTIALAWLAYRPLIGIPLLIVALACIVLGVRALLRRRASAKLTPATPPALP